MQLCGKSLGLLLQNKSPAGRFVSLPLSYCEIVISFFFIMVGLNGLEPSTSRLSGVRSNQLSYRPIIGAGEGNRTLINSLEGCGFTTKLHPLNFLQYLLIPVVGIEPTLQKEHDFESCASANSATPAKFEWRRQPDLNR